MTTGPIVDLAIRCSSADDGAGFDPPAALAHRGGPGLGLLGVQERLEAVRGSFQTAPGRGTTVQILVPLER